MRFLDLIDVTPSENRSYLVLIKKTFGANTRKAYATWTDNGFILRKTLLFNDEYINGYYEE